MNRDLRTILYVDDEPDLRELVKLALTLRPDLHVYTCESGERALELLPRIEPDMLLLDAMMPGTDGPSTLQRIRADAAFASLPVVFVTAKAMPEEIARLGSLGAIAVLTKPFDPLRLADDLVVLWQRVLRD